MTKFIINLLVLIVGLVGSAQAIEESNISLFKGAAIASGITTAIIIVEFFFSNHGYVWSVLKSIFIKQIRISCAYLYNIKVDDQYFLVKNPHRASFQPVGGVFKRNNQSESFLNKIEVKDDDKLPLNRRSTGDLRLYIKGRHLSKYLNWYRNEKEREIDYTREFYEELIENGILSNEEFPYPTFEYKKQFCSPLKWSPHFKCYEILIFDILELQLNEKQKAAFTKLQGVESDNYKWAKKSTILSEGFNQEKNGTPYTIGDHTRWAIEYKYTKK